MSKAVQHAKLVSAFDAARKIGREILIEIIASKSGPLRDDAVSRERAELYDAGLKPDWWKLEPQASVTAWPAIDAVIAARDRGGGGEGRGPGAEGSGSGANGLGRPAAPTAAIVAPADAAGHGWLRFAILASLQVL